MLLAELFKHSAVELHVTSKTIDSCIMSFQIKEKEYQFTAFVNYDDVDVDETGEYKDDDAFDYRWELEFYLLPQSRGARYDVTNTGDAIQVLSAVTACIKKLIQLYPHINHLYFTAKNDEPSRVKLYDRMISNVKLPGWNITRDVYRDVHEYNIRKSGQ